ncbi:MAG TPA: hypothetical protein VG758_24845 [Hyphomicrobiaceae bacterium]|jgi:hypothetical protein|nr:hypothetical protein [Hyphomicrobiaceae bacterium]
MTTTAKDARAFLAVKVGDKPLVPPEIQKRGTALEVALAAIVQLADLKRPRARVLHHRKPPANGRRESRTRLFST